MNRSAVALAADSAVTIRFGLSDKIYNSAEKVFEFSRRCPVGVMLNNSMEYMGFPYDVLIRRFRSEQDRAYNSMADASRAFANYISTLRVDLSHESIHLRRILRDEFSGVYEKYVSSVTRAVIASSETVDGGRIFHSIVDDEIEYQSSIPLEGYLAEVSQEDFDDKFGSVVVNAAKQAFFDLPIDEPEYQKLRRLALTLVKSKRQSNTSTGLVFAGYAQEDFFPSLQAMEIDGCFFGKVKQWITQDNQIDRLQQRAVISPFAQQEMVERFVYGIDSQFEEQLADGVRSVARAVAEQMLSFSSSAKKKKPSIPEDFIENITAAVAREFMQTTVTELKAINLRDVYDIMTVMPKVELASMAEALVSLTSMKRKMSPDSETVGGPVDVALITRGEGFVWIKRKHYFDKDQNPGFFARHYEQAKESDDDGA